MDFVIYRRWRGRGGLVALFPGRPHDLTSDLCVAYTREEGHAGADYFTVMRLTDPAAGPEVADLHTELFRQGYQPVPIRRAQPHHHRDRRLAARLARLRSQGA